MAVDDENTFIHLFDANVLAVDRAARCYAGDPRWNYFDGTTDLFEYAFWETMYGPDGDYPDGTGMLCWDDLCAYDDA